MVIVGVVGGQAIEQAELQFGQPAGVDYVPHALGAGVGRIAQVAHGRMAVVHLEKALALHAHELLGGDAPAEVGMVQVQKHRLPGGFPLGQQGIHVPLHDIVHVVATLRRNLVAQVSGVHVYGRGLPAVGNFLGLDHEKPIGLLQAFAKLF